jgi:integrase
MENNQNNPIQLDPSLHNSCLEYIRRRGLSEKTKVLYEKELNNIFKDRELTQTSFNKIYSKGNYYRSILKLILNTCEHFDIPSYKYKVIKQIAKRKHNPQVWSENDIIKIIDSVEDYGLLIACAYYIGAGLRFSSAILLSWNDFIWEDWIQDKLKTGKCKIKAKGGKEKVLRVNPILMDRLYNLAKEKGKTFQGIPYKNSVEDKHLFIKQSELNDIMDSYKKQNFQKMLDCRGQEVNVKARSEIDLIRKKHYLVDYKLRKLSKLFEGKKIKFHSIRHSSATNLLKKGFKLITIKDQLMHESIATTEIYLNMENSDIEKEFDEKL